MKNDEEARLARDARQRLDNFLDCLARLMAKRWLREQQDEPGCEEDSSNDEPGTSEQASAPIRSDADENQGPAPRAVDD